MIKIQIEDFNSEKEIAKIKNLYSNVGAVTSFTGYVRDFNNNKRYNNKIIAYIIGVPIEFFKEESWARHDYNMDKKNTLYTYSFVVKEQYQRRGGYAKTLKRIYLNWAMKRKYKYITGHVRQGIAKKFSPDTQIVKIFPQWYGQKTPFEYYRRPL